MSSWATNYYGDTISVGLHGIQTASKPVRVALPRKRRIFRWMRDLIIEERYSSQLEENTGVALMFEIWWKNPILQYLLLMYWCLSQHYYKLIGCLVSLSRLDGYRHWQLWISIECSNIFNSYWKFNNVFHSNTYLIIVIFFTLTQFLWE